jgi:hypothetical protein
MFRFIWPSFVIKTLVVQKLLCSFGLIFCVVPWMCCCICSMCIIISSSEYKVHYILYDNLFMHFSMVGHCLCVLLWRLAKLTDSFFYSVYMLLPGVYFLYSLKYQVTDVNICHSCVNYYYSFYVYGISPAWPDVFPFSLLSYSLCQLYSYMHVPHLKRDSSTLREPFLFFIVCMCSLLCTIECSARLSYAF